MNKKRYIRIQSLLKNKKNIATNTTRDTQQTSFLYKLLKNTNNILTIEERPYNQPLFIPTFNIKYLSKHNESYQDEKVKMKIRMKLLGIKLKDIKYEKKFPISRNFASERKHSSNVNKIKSIFAISKIKQLKSSKKISGHTKLINTDNRKVILPKIKHKSVCYNGSSARIGNQNCYANISFENEMMKSKNSLSKWETYNSCNSSLYS